MNDEEHLNSEFPIGEVDKLLTTLPSWIVRNGISLIFMLLIVCVCFSVFVKYPDYIIGTVRIVKTHDEAFNALISFPVGKTPGYGVGNSIHITFENGEDARFIELNGRVNKVLQNNDKHLIEISVLLTDSSGTDSLNDGMNGKACILSENISLLDRIIHPILTSIRKK